MGEQTMESTNPKQFRAELKDYLDLAAKEPIRIQRRSGENYILLKEDSYQELLNEILSLQRRLLGMSQVVSDTTKEYKINDRSRLDRLKRKK
jgi:PHD/YefM family antitoxin component YafN of YafNO toxin-antitoxin module